MEDPDAAFSSLLEEMDQVTKQDLIELGQFATTLILTRTKRGLDADGKPFHPYTEDYAKARSSRGLSSTPDLAVTGHMLGGMAPDVTGPNEVTVSFPSPLEATKAAVHNYGSNSTSSVSPHSRSVYVDQKSGRRVSAREVALDRKRKTKRTAERSESVTGHTRKMNTPQREFLDIRLESELNAMADAITTKLLGRVEKSIK